MLKYLKITYNSLIYVSTEIFFITTKKEARSFLSSINSEDSNLQQSVLEI